MINEKELSLNKILNKILLLEEEISSIITTYYIETPLNINGRIIQMSLFDYEYYEEKDPIYLMLKEFNKHIKNENSKLIRASDLLEEQDYGRK